MFFSEAYAQTAGATGAFGGMDNLVQFAPLVGIFGIMYFLMIRPQQKKAKAHRELVAQLRRGDRVLTQGGIIGVVNKVLSDTEVSVEIADGVRVRFLRSAVAEVLEKTEPVSANGDSDTDGDATDGTTPPTSTGRKAAGKRS